MPASEQVMTRRTCSNAAFSVAAVGHTILVVDRDPQTLASALEHLRSAGYRASGVESFHEARQLLPTIQPNVLIADVRLGAFNGLRLVTHQIVLPNSCGVGASCYRANISACISDTGLGVGGTLTNEPGNMVGPTAQGVNDLIDLDSTATWTQFEPGYPRGTVMGGMGMASPRLAIVPVFNADIYMEGHQNGRIDAGDTEIVVTNFVGIFFNGVTGNTVMGHMMPLDFTPTPDNLSDDPSSFLRTVVLVR